jgi:hypothetical protein
MIMSKAKRKQAARPPYKHPIDTYNEPILMTPTLRKRLRKTGEFKRTDAIRLVHYESSECELYTAYRWPSGRVQWYRNRTITIQLTARASPVRTDEDNDDEIPF